MKVILLLSLLYCTLSQTVFSDCRSGIITSYPYAEAETVSCQLSNAIGDGYFKTAANVIFYNSAKQCGVCYELTGEIGSINVQVTDICADCYGNVTQFDLTPKAFPYLCRKEIGRCNVNYRMISCEVKGGMKIYTKSGCSGYWYGFHVRNYKVGLKDVSIINKGVEYPLSRTAGNFWAYKAANEATKLTVPFTIKVTSIVGEVKSITMEEIDSLKEFPTDVQFSVPKDKFINPFDFSVTKKPSAQQECCSIPGYDQAYKGYVYTPWQVLPTSTAKMTYCKSGDSCPITGTMKAWGMFQLYTNRDVSPDVYEGFEFTVKANETCNIDVFVNANEGSKRKNFKITTTKQTIRLTFEELGTTGYIHGLACQNTFNTHQYEFDNFQLIRKKGACDELCSDGHKSTCSGRLV